MRAASQLLPGGEPTGVSADDDDAQMFAQKKYFTLVMIAADNKSCDNFLHFHCNETGLFN